MLPIKHFVNYICFNVRNIYFFYLLTYLLTYLLRHLKGIVDVILVSWLGISGMFVSGTFVCIAFLLLALDL